MCVNADPIAPGYYASMKFPFFSRISITKVVFLVSLAATALALAVVILVSSHVRQQSIQDLARDEARQTSALVFEALYSAMRKGWSKDEISDVIHRLQDALPDLNIRVIRGHAVIEQFGEYDNDVEITRNDPTLQKVMSVGTDMFVTADTSIRYLYPLVVREECLGCHTAAKVGDVNGVIDIVYPIHALKVSLDYVLNTVLAYFLGILLLLSAVLYFKVKIFVAQPISNMVALMQDIIQRTDLRQRVKTSGFIAEVADLTDYFNRLLRTVEEYQARLEDLSVRDPMTRLYNRRKFDEFLRHEVDRADRHGHSFGMIQIDLDDFKTINDSFGHPIGDLLLKELASVLTRETRRTDIVARLGGDEFAVLLPETDADEAARVADKLRSALAETIIDLPVGSLRITASIGLVTFPENGTDAAKLGIAVDVAMYKAKRGGKNQVATLDDKDDAAAATFSKAELVRSALAEGRVIPHFQPILDTASGAIFAYEVLARVIAPDGVIVAAGDFIEQAEEMGLAAEIDNAVFEQGLRVLASGALGHAKLFVNMSARSFADHPRMLAIPDQLARLGIDPQRIVLEVTEREALPHFGEVVRLINELRAQGISFALDDFGAGFSSFLYLKYIAVDYVKIEGSFIRHMVTDERDRIMVEHIHAMARRFGMVTVAEFVEDAATLALLKEMGIDRAQGFHLGMPKDMRKQA